MSRRYGRKQRREARAAIAERDETLWHARQALLKEGIRSGDLARKVDALLGTITTWDREMRNLLGEFTALAIQPAEIKQRAGQRVDRLSITPPMPSFVSAESCIPEMVEYHVATIYHLVAGLDEPDRMRMSRLMFMKIERDGYREAEACYGLSEDYWRWIQRGAADQLNRRLAEQVIPDMLRILTRPPAPKPAPRTFHRKDRDGTNWSA